MEKPWFPPCIMPPSFILLCFVPSRSFGIQHDGKENDCEPVGRHPYIMSRQLQYNPTPLTWSKCSKEYITRFLE